MLKLLVVVGLVAMAIIKPAILLARHRRERKKIIDEHKGELPLLHHERRVSRFKLWNRKG